MTYEQAISRLEAITEGLTSGQTGIDQLVSQLTEAKTLIAQCQKQLTEVETQVNALTNENPDTTTNDTRNLWEKEN
ncbi:MAG: exodeoxyribonuclease VII small subunit [Bacteroidaceae bacterium]|nr:exodeoxyribonuclease VII small subunit [Bacteroidaceae bacterium]MBQ8675551.1 exodeoxyribonuclease VII small subunit [Bacteroidaceae bacterium]MBQ9177121.1 exodeoxyribonuclease VII small subunit [Bacteroidaceae bacterium]MBR1379160.1 exodeoxyribonuclease VII small subunit [Bacteroidaceae bacterium]